MKKVVVLTGAGISAESGIPTFRDADGLWEGHSIEDVATPGGWMRNPELVLEFYNQRRKRAREVNPNRAHAILAELESHFEVVIITQNVDDLHERAGSSNVLHLHGSLFESRSTRYPELVYPIEGWELKMGDVCDKGAQLRPNIVWFGEIPFGMDIAEQHAATADFFLVVGTSMVVYPAASLIHYVSYDTPKFVVDPKLPDIGNVPNVSMFAEKASTGMEHVRTALLEMK